MKTIIALALVSIVSGASISSSFAAEKLVCKTSPEKLGGFTSVTITFENEYTATLTGFQSGGAAHFMRNIGPFNVKASHEADVTSYSNKEQDISLNVVRTGIEGQTFSTAVFSEGKDDSTPMNCQVQL